MHSDSAASDAQQGRRMKSLTPDPSPKGEGRQKPSAQVDVKTLNLNPLRVTKTIINKKRRRKKQGGGEAEASIPGIWPLTPSNSF